MSERELADVTVAVKLAVDVTVVAGDAGNLPVDCTKLIPDRAGAAITMTSPSDRTERISIAENKSSWCR